MTLEAQPETPRKRSWEDTLPWITTAGAGTTGGLLGQRLFAKPHPVLGAALGAMSGAGLGLGAGMHIGRRIDNLQKSANTRSYMSDFLGGVDPTGTKTFQYGQEDALQGQRSGARRAVGTVGGVLGGAAVLPAAIGGTIGGIKGGLLGRGGIRARLMGALGGAARGAKQPYTSLYHGVQANRALAAHQAGRALNPRQAQQLHRFVEGSIPAGLGTAVGKYNSPRSIQQRLTQLSPQAMTQVRRQLGSEIGGGAASLGLSGLISGGSAYMQYGKGGGTGEQMLQMQKTSAYRRGFDTILNVLGLR